MTPCDDSDYSEKWCCGDSRDCCDRGDYLILRRDIASKTTSTSMSTSTEASTTASQTTSSTRTSTSVSTPSSSQTTESNPSSGLSTGGKAGVGVGVSVGVIAIVGALAFLLLHRRKHKFASVDQELPASQTQQGAGASGLYEKPAGGQDTRYELHAESAETTNAR